MKGSRLARSVLCAVIGLVIVLGVQFPVRSALVGLQAMADWRGEYYAGTDLIGAPALVRDDRDPSGTPGIDFGWKVTIWNRCLRWSRSWRDLRLIAGEFRCRRSCSAFPNRRSPGELAAGSRKKARDRSMFDTRPVGWGQGECIGQVASEWTEPRST